MLMGRFYKIKYILSSFTKTLNSDKNILPGYMPFGWLQVLHQGEQPAFQLVFHESMAKDLENLQNEVLSAQFVG